MWIVGRTLCLAHSETAWHAEISHPPALQHAGIIAAVAAVQCTLACACTAEHGHKAFFDFNVLWQLWTVVNSNRCKLLGCCGIADYACKNKYMLCRVTAGTIRQPNWPITALWCC
jgi:hypothetical protein